MLSAIGLALDVIGAAVLSIGLFRASSPLLLGWSRDPLQVTVDEASGTTGFLFLFGGFALQSLPSFGVDTSSRAGDARLAAAITLVVGVLLAWVVYELLRVWFFRREAKHTARTYQPFGAMLRFRPGVDREGRGSVPRLWQTERDRTGEG